jgi:hypothetical protein
MVPSTLNPDHPNAEPVYPHFNFEDRDGVRHIECDADLVPLCHVLAEQANDPADPIPAKAEFNGVEIFAPLGASATSLYSQWCARRMGQYVNAVDTGILGRAQRSLDMALGGPQPKVSMRPSVFDALTAYVRPAEIWSYVSRFNPPEKLIAGLYRNLMEGDIMPRDQRALWVAAALKRFEPPAASRIPSPDVVQV